MAGGQKTTSQLLDESAERVRLMTPKQLAQMHEAQRQSYVRSVLPCEHGVADFEDCLACRVANG